jgi:hypothetical protein
MNKPYVVMENRHNGLQAIKLTEDPFSGIMYTYGKVSFDEDAENNTATINFEYEVLDWAHKEMLDLVPLEKILGDILQELIHEGIKENNLTYTGGTEIDANRTKDSEQSDI